MFGIILNRLKKHGIQSDHHFHPCFEFEPIKIEFQFLSLFSVAGGNHQGRSCQLIPITLATVLEFLGNNEEIKGM